MSHGDGWPGTPDQCGYFRAKAIEARQLVIVLIFVQMKTATAVRLAREMRLRNDGLGATCYTTYPRKEHVGYHATFPLIHEVN